MKKIQEEPAFWVCPNHRDNHLCFSARRMGEHEKLSETDAPRHF